MRLTLGFFWGSAKSFAHLGGVGVLPKAVTTPPHKGDLMFNGPRRNRFIALVVACLAVVGASVAFAGTKDYRPVVINTASNVAYGSTGDARASGDTQQNIGCNLQGYDSGIYAYCEARNSAGVSRYCTSYSTSLVQAAAATSPGSYLYFAWNGGTCTEISAVNNSRYRPVTP
jgi:hypothetical protein